MKERCRKSKSCERTSCCGLGSPRSADPSPLGGEGAGLLQPDGLSGIRIQQQFQIGFAQAELLLAVGDNARDGDGAADEMGAIGTACDEVFTDLNVPTSEREFARAEARGGDGIGDEDGLSQTGDAQIILQGEEVDVDAVGDEAEPQLVTQRQGALDDIVVAMHEHRAAVADMGEHRQTMLGGGTQRLQARIAVTGGDSDAVVRQKLGDVEVLILLRRQRDDLGESTCGIEQTLRVLQIRRPHALRRMRADVAFLRIQEGPLDVNPDDDTAREFILLTQPHERAHAPLECGDIISDEGGEDGVAIILTQTDAGVMQRLSGEVVAIEVGASIAIDLEIEWFHADLISRIAPPCQQGDVPRLGAFVSALRVHGSDQSLPQGGKMHLRQ